MRKGFTRYICLFILLIPFSCIRNVDPPIRTVPPKLVVEGWITTDPPPYTVNLSYSGKFTNASQVAEESFITDAKMSIIDDLGDSTECIWVGNGSYQSADSNFIGKVGRSYTLKIYLSDGNVYISSAEKIEPVPPIDSVSITYDSSVITDVRPNQLIVSVNLKDPGGVSNFYRWTASGYVPRKSWGDSCKNFAGPCPGPFACDCAAYCEQFQSNNQINVMSDQYLDGKNILMHPVFYSPLYWFGSHFIEIKQYSLSRTAYLFWEQYLAQTNRTGSILDPLPASLTGNIYNQANSNDVALGLFSASDVVSKKIVIVPKNMQKYWLESVAGQFIPKGSCHGVFPNSLENDTDPQGWGGAQEIDLQ
ncbi:MAG TPA: DUF4249 domain-containing protein [Puia sp.]|nr:DUF4249 domain-containing protein [Puia sp.]